MQWEDVWVKVVDTGMGAEPDTRVGVGVGWGVGRRAGGQVGGGAAMRAVDPHARVCGMCVRDWHSVLRLLNPALCLVWFSMVW